MNTDGTGLLQLTSTSSSRGRFGQYQLSGDGTRVVFSASADYTGSNPTQEPRVWVVDTDGTDLHEVSSGAGAAAAPSISDDGERIVFFEFAETPGVMAYEAGTGDRRLLASPGVFPEISGDGTTVFFGQFQGPCPGLQLAVIDWDGSGHGTLSCHYAGAATGGVVQSPDIVDDGSLSFYAAYGADTAPDGGFGWEIWSAPPQAQVTAADQGVWPSLSCREASVSGSGNLVGFTCSGGSLIDGANLDGSRQLYVANPDGSGVRQLSDGREGRSVSPGLTADGEHLVFVSSANPLGEAGVLGSQAYSMSPVGGAITRLTDAGTDAREAAISADGTGLTEIATLPQAAVRELDLTADGATIVFERGFGIYRIGSDGSGLLFLGQGEAPRIAADGSWVVYRDATAVWRVRPDGTDAEQLPFPGDVDGDPDISGDGTRIAYPADSEIVLYEPLGGTTTVLTGALPGAAASRPVAIADDGAYIYFQWRARDDLWLDSFEPYELYRAEVATGRIDRVGPALACRVSGRLSSDAAGTLVAFSAGRGCVGENPDGEPELYVMDLNASPVLTVGPDPGVVSWTAVAGAASYDVIRGDVGEIDATGSTVSVGAVHCVEADSADYDTRGSEDTEVPAPGRVFFYLFRGSPSLEGSPDAYGRSSYGRERFASSGDCPG